VKNKLLIAWWAAWITFAAAAISHGAEYTNAWVDVTWTFATNNMDGSPLTDLAGAKVYYGLSSSNYTAVVTVPGGTPGGTVTYRVRGLRLGTKYYLNGTAYNLAELESDFCNEVIKTTPSRPNKWKSFFSGSSGVDR